MLSGSGLNCIEGHRTIRDRDKNPKNKIKNKVGYISDSIAWFMFYKTFNFYNEDTVF